MGFVKSCKAAVVAALALAAVPQGVALPLLAGGMVFAAGEAVAADAVPGIVVILKLGKTVVAKAVTDEKGEARFEGLKPVEYSVFVGDNDPIPCFGEEGGSGTIIAIVAVEGTKHEYVGHVTLLR
jgi:hypothetical protein